jgi:putative FmdB family regulatory protein
MPLYEYRCPECSRRFELLQPVGASAEAVPCPACGATGAERQLSTFAAHGSSAAKGTSSEGFGCGLPQCSGGTCAGADWN